MKVYENVVNWSPDLFEKFKPVPELSRTITVEEESHLHITGHIDARHRAIAKTKKKAIVVAFRVKLNGKWLKGSKTGENIVGKQDHYYSAQIHGYALLKKGKHVIEIHGRSASSAARRVNGLAEVKGGFNQVVYTITKAE